MGIKKMHQKDCQAGAGNLVSATVLRLAMSGSLSRFKVDHILVISLGKIFTALFNLVQNGPYILCRGGWI